MISDYFQKIKIKHEDWPYLLSFSIPVILLSCLTIYFVDQVTGLVLLVVLVFFSLLIYLTHLYRLIRKDLRNQQQKTQAYLMLLQLLDIDKPLPFMSDWAATPELSLTITDIIHQKQPNFIVELGSGISTLISSKNLKKINKGRVLALDHDILYTRKTQQQLKNHNLESIATAQHAPLTTIEMDRGNWIWYDLSNVNFDNTPIDLLIVDGPPVKTQKFARYPALPLFYPRLADDAVVILHDTHRKSESTFIKWWIEEFQGIVVEKTDTEKGVAVIYLNKEATHESP